MRVARTIFSAGARRKPGRAPDARAAPCGRRPVARGAAGGDSGMLMDLHPARRVIAPALLLALGVAGCRPAA
ncbi:MAG TPA: hypothetical protein VGE02_16705, partial [Gemmatimonadales bacterium]